MDLTPQLNANKVHILDKKSILTTAVAELRAVLSGDAVVAKVQGYIKDAVTAGETTEEDVAKAAEAIGDDLRTHVEQWLSAIEIQVNDITPIDPSIAQTEDDAPAETPEDETPAQ